MAKMTVKKFSSPDETRSFQAKGRIDLVKVGDATVGRGVFEPGWKWSTHVKPIAKTESCQATHSGYVLSGRMHIVMDDGLEAEIEPGDYVFIPPGHDAWTVGNDACVLLDFSGAEHYARAGREAQAGAGGRQPPAH
ncbi:cupin domain-containing protein [Anaeromyxobacter oryzisoli]|uniref:cupin domain-containing protein n=1 Tax=Anaeromyxobacter oryzisoli TaxID=2925408 RepID=UPI001F58E12E|nr:cupin domain-containing protein [Anaeromyxobacter sp. SG63]